MLIDAHRSNSLPSCRWARLQGCLRRLLAAALTCTMAIAGCKRGGTESPATQPAPAAKSVARSAEAGPLRGVVSVDRDRIGINDVVELTVRLEAPGPLDNVPAPFTGAVGDFLIRETRESTPDCGPGASCRAWTFLLETALPGEHTLPGLNIPFVMMETQADGTQQPVQTALQTEPITITVEGALADIRNDPMTVGGPFQWTLFWWAIGVIGAMATIGLAARYWPGRKAPARLAPEPPPVIPHEWALAELEKLERENLVGRGLAQEYYYRINALLRRYIELRFEMNAGEQTSEEFIRDLQYSRELAAPHKSLLVRFVEACDPVKYAAQVPDANDVAWVATAGRQFILDTARTPQENGARETPRTSQEAAR